MTQTVVLPVGNVEVQLIIEGDAIARMTMNGKPWELETRGMWGRLNKQCDVILDVGAYTGVYAIASALMGMRAVAFEPYPANMTRLRQNAALNKVHIETLPIAASDGDDPPVWLRSKRGPDCLSDTATLDDGQFQHAVLVPRMRIDKLKISGRIGLIKIDVEGHEASVIRGAAQMIELHRPTIVVETLSELAHKSVWRLMDWYGYREWGVLDGRNRLYVSR